MVRSTRDVSWNQQSPGVLDAKDFQLPVERQGLSWDGLSPHWVRNGALVHENVSMARQRDDLTIRYSPALLKYPSGRFLQSNSQLSNSQKESRVDPGCPCWDE